MRRLFLTAAATAALLATVCSATAGAANAGGDAKGDAGADFRAAECSPTAGDTDATADGMVTEARRSNMDFTKIEISALVDLIIEERTDGNIIIRAHEQVMPRVRLSVENGVLCACTIDAKGRQRKDVPANARVEIRIPDNGKIVSIEASGVSSVVSKGILRGDRFALTLSGVSTADLNIETQRASIDITGVSKAALAIKAQRATVDVSGASKAALALDCDSMSADITGASKASVTGDAGRGTIDVSGASKVALDCRGEVTAAVSGASKLQYGDGCRLTVVDNSGLSSINKL